MPTKDTLEVVHDRYRFTTRWGAFTRLMYLPSFLLCGLIASILMTIVVLLVIIAYYLAFVLVSVWSFIALFIGLVCPKTGGAMLDVLLDYAAVDTD